MSIRVSQLKDHYISVYQALNATYVVDKYLDIVTFKTSTKFYKITLPSDMIFNKDDVYTSDDKVGKQNREFNIHYRACIGSFIYLLYTRVDLSFSQYIRVYKSGFEFFSVYQALNATYVVDKYLDIVTFKTSTKFYKITLPSDMIFNKDDVYTSDDKVGKQNREFSIHYRACIGSLIYLLYTRVDLSFSVHKLTMVSSKTSGVHFDCLVHFFIYIMYNKTLGLKQSAEFNDAPVSDLLRQVSINTENNLIGFL